MKTKSILTIGFLSMLAATSVVTTTDSFAAHPGRVDVIGTYDKATQQDSGKTTAGPLPRVDVIDTITHGGPSYPYMKPMNR
ncbi:MAG TPA: hypothetical protein VLE46_13185 [Nitrospira sp.]|nr:hypothetical protein [Nitrospira sp.]